MGHIKREHLSQAKVLIPPDQLMQQITIMLEPFLEKAVQNDLQSRSLAEIRDALLPKLMRGGIRVGEV